MVQPVNIVFDASVFAMAQTNPAARTGIFFLLRDLTMALEASGEVNLSIMAAPGWESLLAQAVQGGPLARTLDPARQRSIGTESWSFLSGFHPTHPQVFTVPRMSVFQMVYDLTYHALPQLGTTARDFEAGVMASIARDGHAVCISQNTLDDAVRLFGFPKARGHVVYPAVRSDLGRGEAGAREGPPAWTGLSAGTRYVLALSTLEPRKNLITSLKAFTLACEAAPEADLYFLVGGLDGWGEQAQLLETVPAAVRAKIRLLGYVNDPQLPGLLEGAMCLIYPSLYEGFGLPPLEAMARGVPVIASNAGSLPEAVGEGGMVFDPYDADGRGAAIVRLARGPAERAGWVAKGYEQAKRFSWARSAAQLIGIMRANAR